jgi:tellurite resistance protein TerC
MGCWRPWVRIPPPRLFNKTAHLVLSTLLSASASNEWISFGVFLVFIFLMLALDLGLFNRHVHVVKTREAAGWTVLWVTLSACIYVVLYNYGHLLHGIESISNLQEIQAQYKQPFKIIPSDFDESLHNYRSVLAIEYITGYIVELSLSVDNIFVIILIFSSFGVEKKMYHRVLFFGILGAIVFRFIFIFAGSYLISKFFWVTYVFAAFLVFTGIRIFLTRDKEDKIDTERHPIVKFCAKHFRVHPSYAGKKFTVKINGRSFITPLFVVLLIVEFTDLIFAVDSVPAVFAITSDPYIVFFSNIFAIMGLRSMFFLLLNALDKIHYFKIGLSFILVFVGLKMFFEEWLHHIGFTTGMSLLVIVGILLISIVASLLFPPKKVEILN